MLPAASSRSNYILPPPLHYFVIAIMYVHAVHTHRVVSNVEHSGGDDGRHKGPVIPLGRADTLMYHSGKEIRVVLQIAKVFSHVVRHLCVYKDKRFCDII